MPKTIHRPVRIGCVGKRDAWGYGSAATVWDYPTLGLKGIVTESSVGGPVHPEIHGVRPVYRERSGWANEPPMYWDSHSPTYHLPGGKVLVAVIVDGERCFEEEATVETPQ